MREAVGAGGSLGRAGSMIGVARARAMLQACAPRSRTRGKVRLMSWDGQSGESNRREAPYEQPFDEPHSDFIPDVVDLTAHVRVGRDTLLLEELGIAIKDLHGRRAGGLHRIGTEVEARNKVPRDAPP